jgi:hypothetical protein
MTQRLQNNCGAGSRITAPSAERDLLRSKRDLLRSKRDLLKSKRDSFQALKVEAEEGYSK